VNLALDCAEEKTFRKLLYLSKRKGMNASKGNRLELKIEKNPGRRAFLIRRITQQQLLDEVDRQDDY